MGWQLIESQSLSASAASVTFSNIPQTYKSILICTSTRCDGAVTRVFGAVRFNGDTSNSYTSRAVWGNSTSTNSASWSTTFGYFGENVGTSSTSNTFGNSNIRVSNYAGTSNKSYASEEVSENNSGSADAAYQSMTAGLWSSSSAITSVTIFPGGGYNFVFGSTFTLYGLA